MDLDKTAFAVNNITFPIISERSKTIKIVKPNFARNRKDENIKSQNKIKSFTKKKKNKEHNSL